MTRDTTVFAAPCTAILLVYLAGCGAPETPQRVQEAAARQEQQPVTVVSGVAPPETHACTLLVQGNDLRVRPDTLRVHKGDKVDFCVCDADRYDEWELGFNADGPMKEKLTYYGNCGEIDVGTVKWTAREGPHKYTAVLVRTRTPNPRKWDEDPEMIVEADPDTARAPPN